MASHRAPIGCPRPGRTGRHRRRPVGWAATRFNHGLRLPVGGRLAFFVLDKSDDYDFADGSEPDSYQVLHLPTDGTLRPTPPGASAYGEQTLTARQVVTAPDTFDPALPMALGVDADADYRAWLDHPVQAPEFSDALEALRGPLARHQVGGWATAVQGPVEVEAASAEVRRRPLEPEVATADGTDPWVLLFQVDSYDGAQWGDVGTLYWLAHTDDLARGDLSNTRFVMQSC
ncbi:DUF1963 domain-containing protein [Promicromonospora sp. NPDC019610]|uniref:DUF1963 domain-containing protein n=1 Tax=Promicromonospora sp. NPDC019610 TaxID=3364405 RepID=UPI0037AD6565